MLHIARKPLTEAVNSVSRVAGSDFGRAGLIRLTAADGTLTVESGTGEAYLERTVQADVETPFDYTYPAQVLDQLVRALQGELVELKADAEGLKLTSGGATLTLIPVDAALSPPTWPTHYPQRAPGVALRTALDTVVYAAATAGYQAHMCGVALEVDGLACTAVGTDGFRLASSRFDLEGTAGAPTAILPRKAVAEIVRLLPDAGVSLAVTDAHLFLNAPGIRLMVGLIEGHFPDWRRVLPGHFPLSFEVDADALTAAIKRVALLADKTANNRVDCVLGGSGALLTSNGPYGSSREVVEGALSGEQERLELAFNADYALAALAKISGTALMQFSGATSPTIVSEVGATAYTAMIVPLRTE